MKAVFCLGIMFLQSNRMFFWWELCKLCKALVIWSTVWVEQVARFIWYLVARTRWDLPKCFKCYFNILKTGLRVSFVDDMKVDLGQNVRLVVSLWRYVVWSFRCSVSSFWHTGTPGRLVAFRGRLGEVPVRLVVLRARHIRLSFCRFVVSSFRYGISSFRCGVSSHSVEWPLFLWHLLAVWKVCYNAFYYS